MKIRFCFLSDVDGSYIVDFHTRFYYLFYFSEFAVYVVC